MSLQLSNDISIEFKESAKRFEFDDNSYGLYISEYGGSETIGTPWNFITNGDYEKLNAKASSGKGYYAVNNITSKNPLLTISPPALTKRNEEITLTFSGSGRNSIGVRGCHETDPELWLFTESPKSFEIEFFEICESDDDIQMVPVGTTVASSTDVCIDSGADGSIDLMYQTGFVKGDDKAVYNGVRKVHEVVAGPNKICETTMHPNGLPKCPTSSFNVAGAMTYITNLFAKVGITPINRSVTQLNINFDVVNDDQLVESPVEASHIYTKRLLIDQALSDPFVEVHLVNDLGTTISSSGSLSTVLGKAIPSSGFNFALIDSKEAKFGTLSHEIGHARWSLTHPDQPPLSVPDPNNFMFSESNYVKDEIRRYQFDAIHN